jgi:ADP-heptose:LPS heptosyltransferase
VAILRADHIGDLVLTTSLMQALAKGGWHVDVIGQPAVALLENCGFVRHAESLRAICPRWPRDWRKLAAWLREHDYTAIIVPFCRPAALLWASARGGAKYRIAMGTTSRARFLARLSGHRFFYTDFIRRPRPYYEIMVECASPLIPNPDVLPPEITLTPKERSEGKSRLASHVDGAGCIGVHPTCFGNTCNLPLSAYRALIELIMVESSWSVVITGTHTDRPLLEEWKALADAHPRRIWISAGELGLRELASVLSSLDVLVATGTGPMHLARAVGTRTVSPFCPQAPICPQVWGYPPYEESAVLPDHPPCDPSRPHGRSCDFKGTITARDLMNRLRALLPA